MSSSLATATVDFAAEGRQVGDLRFKWSDNSVPLGLHLVPVISLRRGDGPVVVMFGGTHGDEFEGPAALMRLADRLPLDALNGQVIIVPALNTAAFVASVRVSPLDGVNLNRAFPGDPLGSLSAQIAAYVETKLLSLADFAIDLHSGGAASFFQPCTLATRTADPMLYARNLAMAEAFGLPLIWVLGGFNDDRSLNSAAERACVPMIATELGGGGGVDPQITDSTELGLYRVLHHAGVIDAASLQALAPESSSVQLPVHYRKVEIQASEHSLFAPGDGVFDRCARAGQQVRAGQLAGTLRYATDPRRASEPVVFTVDGYVLAHTQRGFVKRGDMLLLVVQDAE